jgi:hypothetical protein
MDRYPRLTFRLSHRLLTNINHLSISRHRTRGQIIREAVEMYYRVHNPITRLDNSAVEEQLKSPNKNV